MRSRCAVPSRSGTTTASLFLSPHNDDETLFAAFTLLRYKPLVVICLRSQVQEDRGYGITAAMREAETRQAVQVLGCDLIQWPFSDADPDWDALRARLQNLDGGDRVFAPAVEDQGIGHPHHDKLGQLADDVFGRDNITHYLTYTQHGKSTWGTEVPYELPWIGRKLRALSCYTSQYGHPSCQEHFVRDQREYYA